MRCMLVPLRLGNCLFLNISGLRGDGSARAKLLHGHTALRGVRGGELSRADQGQHHRQKDHAVKEGHGNHEAKHAKVVITEEGELGKAQRHNRKEGRGETVRHGGHHLHDSAGHAVVLGALGHQEHVRHMGSELHSQAHRHGQVDQTEGVQLDAENVDEAVHLNDDLQNHQSHQDGGDGGELEDQSGEEATQQRPADDLVQVGLDVDVLIPVLVDVAVHVGVVRVNGIHTLASVLNHGDEVIVIEQVLGVDAAGGSVELDVISRLILGAHDKGVGAPVTAGQIAEGRGSYSAGPSRKHTAEGSRGRSVRGVGPVGGVEARGRGDRTGTETVESGGARKQPRQVENALRQVRSLQGVKHLLEHKRLA
mmetsp:Transcript_1165/g.2442  ORF Transcript_1165/g.2442 Transcript_1165/m.2442 type:complete len:366 (-) Transcript_1165:1660-2757(-)